jgi:uncharacterized protein YndB with AHSA1/START domain
MSNSLRPPSVRDMSTHSLEFSFESSASPEALFAVITDGANWAKHARPLIAASSWAHRGNGEPGAVGDIRTLWMGPIRLREETLEYDAPRKHVYALLQPAPIKDYVSTVTITPHGTGSSVRWATTFADKIPGSGAVLAKVLKPGLAQVAKKLAKAAEKA